MHRPLVALLGTFALCAMVFWYVYVHFSRPEQDLLKIIGGIVILPNLALLYYQNKRSLLFERRKATHDFMFGPIVSMLLPLERRLQDLTKQPRLVFSSKEEIPGPLSLSYEELKIVVDILNTYERIAISINKTVLDDEMLYDDKGFVLIRFIDWAQPYINQLRQDVHPRVYANTLQLAHRWKMRYDNAQKHIAGMERSLLDALALRKGSPYS